MYKNKKTGIFGIVITIIILIIIVIFSNNENGEASIFENVLNKIVVPIQSGFTYIENGINNNDSFFAEVDKLKEENKNLKQKNSELEQSVREMENVKTENDTLKEYLKLTEKYGEYKTIPGYVVNRDISNYSKIIVINIGQDDGVEKNMTVIGDEGLVGYIISTTSSTSKVQTIIDTSSSVSALLSTSQDSVVCKGNLGTNRELKAMYIPTDAKISQGDSVQTSGIGGIYPKGINIGKVKEVVNTQNIIDRYAIIETAVNFEKLTSVLVVKNK